MTIYLLLFILGLMVGSFLNVVIFRLPEAESIWRKRSHCRKCKKELPWYDLIPFLSFIVLSGKCRFCQEKISWQYPLVELLTALLFVASYQLAFAAGQSWWFTFFYLLFICFFIPIAFIDLRTYFIPDILVYSVIAWAVVFAGTLIFLKEMTLISALLGLLIGAGFLGSLVLIGRGKWMGAGDVKLGAASGLLLGWPQILVGLFFAFLSGSIISLILIAKKKKTIKDLIPFGPFLVLGTIIAVGWGEKILEWYLR